ncbi:hypothetical protein [Methanoculleus sp. UBA303]|jgi:hypothetical protein|uniref:hypothetical protein n=1 Tax=Methanoculleus sp. UBA303 TaxID=1915497 RepID=UPI0025D9D105|nr:hypothetical protein [Methanoculleus sp. UBA303]
MQRRDRIDGSPRDEACANIDSHGTADNSSPSRAIRAATGERRAGVVPLYLIPQAVADEIRRHGRAVREIHIHRTRNHHYTVSVERGRP